MRLCPWSSRRAGLAVLAGLALSAPGALAQAADPADDNEVHVNFEDRPAGRSRSSFETALTGKGGPVRWELLRDESAPNGPTVLAETSGDRTSDRFPLAILKGFEAKDVEVKVRFKPVSGKVDQAAGLVVRLRDEDNYYIARANALEDNVRLYKVVDGKRRQFAGVDVEVPSGRMAGAGAQGRGRPAHGLARRQGALRRDRPHLRGGGPGGAVDQGRQPDPFRRPGRAPAAVGGTAVILDRTGSPRHAGRLEPVPHVRPGGT